MESSNCQRRDSDDHDHNNVIPMNVTDFVHLVSVDNFRSTPIDTFRINVTNSLQSILKETSYHPDGFNDETERHTTIANNDNIEHYNIQRYDSNRIYKYLNALEWKDLCKQHDDLVLNLNTSATCLMRDDGNSNNTNRNVQSSCLSELLSILNNPTIVPRCLVQPLTKIYVNAIVISPRVIGTAATVANSMRWTPSQSVLLQFMKLNMKYSMDDQIPSAIYQYVQEGTNLFSSRTPNQINRLLSVIYWFVDDSSSNDETTTTSSSTLILVSAASLLLQCIDDWDIQLHILSSLSAVERKAMSNGDNENTKSRTNNTTKSKSHEGICTSCDRIIIAKSSSTSFSRNNQLQYGYLSNLHDNDEFNTLYYNRSHNKTIDRLMSNHSKYCTCTLQQRSLLHDQQTTTTKLTNDWSIVRSRAYKKFITFLMKYQEQQQQNLLSTISNNDLTTKRTNFLSFLDEITMLQYAIAQTPSLQSSPSWRVCLLLLAYTYHQQHHSSSGSYYYMKIASYFWKQYEKCSQQHEQKQKHRHYKDFTNSISNASSIWLRIYSEWIGDCFFFSEHHHREYAWEALRPLKQKIMTLIESKQNSEDNYTESDKNSCCEKGKEFDLLACLGYILMRHSHLFQQSDSHRSKKCHIDNEFKSLTGLLSIHFGSSSAPWLRLFAKNDENRDIVQSTLQQLEILGFSSLDLNRRKEISPHHLKQSNDQFRRLALDSWPFSPLFTLRLAIGRIDDNVFCLEGGKDARKLLLSRRVSASKSRKDKEKKSKTAIRNSQSVSLMDYIQDDDIFGTIFSFCGFKRLIKIQQVCRSWKSVIDKRTDTLWLNAYIARFGGCKGDRPLDSNNSHVAWKEVFIQKHIAEQSLCHKRNGTTGCKYRTCAYLGCFQVLKTSQQEEKHMQMHQRISAKKKVQKERKRKRSKSTKQVDPKQNSELQYSKKRCKNKIDK